MQSVTLYEAQKHLAELIRELAPDAELWITDENGPVAKLSSVPSKTSLRDLKPRSVGAVLQSVPSPGEDLLDEMLRSKQ